MITTKLRYINAPIIKINYIINVVFLSRLCKHNCDSKCNIQYTIKFNINNEIYFTSFILIFNAITTEQKWA